MTVPASLRQKRLGLVIHSYWQRWHGRLAMAARPLFGSALDVLRHARSLGAGSFQITVKGWDAGFAEAMRAEAEAAGMKLEASLDLPRDEADLARFEHEVALARRAGMAILRTWIGGRRYEDFATPAEFAAFKARAQRGLELAEPIMRRHGARLAAENHKDFHAAELAAMLARLGSDRLGVCLDFGNNLALLEDPIIAAETLAPLALTTHLKDLAVQASPDGFRMAEVPLGEGLLDLPRMLALVERANPRIEHHLEMITREPLEIRCRRGGYWASFPDGPREAFGRTLALVHARAAPALPSLAGLAPDEILAREEANNRRCFAAAARLGFSAAHGSGAA